jgi:hypothetical protein
MAKKARATKGAAKSAGPRRPTAVAATVRLAAAAPHPVQVKHLALPPKYVKPKRIHPRRVLPFIREGAERGFHSTTMQASFRRPLHPAVAALAETDEVVVITNTELTSPGQQQTASNVDEPSTAANDQVVFYTGNWYAARSTDGGRTFQFIDPANAFKASDPANSSFCCDQVVHYIPKIDTFVWLLQYGNAEQSDNIQRLAFAKTADVIQGRWRLFDITTDMLGVSGAFLDFPDLAVGDNALYVTTNIFPGGDAAGSAVVRIPLDGIDSGHVTATRFVSMELQSFRVAQNCGTTAFFAAHEDTSTLSVFSWDEGQAAPTPKSVAVARWIGGNGYQSRTPDGHRWLDRADPRITGATLANNELWFAWTVDSGSNQRPRPFIQIARIDARNLTLLDNVNVFDPDSATAYPAHSTNAVGEVGISYMIGGGSRFPTHVVGILTGTRRDIIVAAGDRGPLDDPTTGKGEWGDFLTVRRMYPNQKHFVATGYTLKGPGDGSNRDATPRYVVFGRADGAGPGPTGGGGTAGGEAEGGPVEDTSTGPGEGIAQDVNEMPVVSASLAARIKAQAGVDVGPSPIAAAEAELEPELVTKPGVDRWPVKTGTDLDVRKVRSQIVPTTVEELISIPRPADMQPPTRQFEAYQQKRAAPVETTIWTIEVEIIALKQETDGDYHLVLQGGSGETMIGEIPTPRPPFVQNSSPWLANIKAARAAVDSKILKTLPHADFVPLNGKWVPPEAVSSPPAAGIEPPASFTTPEAGAAGPAFKTKITPTRARITGVGFFDAVHGQMGVSQSNGIELHPILKIEWI